VTLLRAGVSQLQVATIGSPLPNVGEGLGGEGDTSLQNQFPIRPWVRISECLRELQLCAPLTPYLFRVGARGTEVHRVFQETKRVVT
jgi:hypothetical protein